jgi:GWxTD domain-containing protein
MAMAPWIAASLLVVIAAPGPATPSLRKWADSAEAVFLTKDETRTWKHLADDPARTAFIDAYWARRDPKPETPANEFRDAVLQRIAEADRQFALGSRRGADTERGRVFVLLGQPSTMQQTAGPIDTVPRQGAFGLELPDTALQNREWHTWEYDAARSLALQMAHRPSVTVSFVVNPGRNDTLEKPGAFEPVRAAVAEASVRQPPQTR